jgi:hypothetical protein
MRMPQRFRRKRRRLAREYLRGDGIEIGALNEPLQLPAGARVRYVDRLPLDELRGHYPELGSSRLTEPQILDDGERLSSIEPRSLDFIVANHFIEHTEDPIGTIERHLELLCAGGILFMAVPDQRETFDSGREPTSLEHLLRDHRDGPDSSRNAHYLEFARYFKGLSGPDAEVEAARVRDSGYSIHFHVWTRETFEAFLENLRVELGLPFKVEGIEPNHHEFIVVLRKLPDSPAA